MQTPSCFYSDAKTPVSLHCFRIIPGLAGVSQPFINTIIILLPYHFCEWICFLVTPSYLPSSEVVIIHTHTHTHIPLYGPLRELIRLYLIKQIPSFCHVLQTIHSFILESHPAPAPWAALCVGILSGEKLIHELSYRERCLIWNWALFPMDQIKIMIMEHLGVRGNFVS